MSLFPTNEALRGILAYHWGESSQLQCGVGAGVMWRVAVSCNTCYEKSVSSLSRCVLLLLRVSMLPLLLFQVTTV
jgi:hypothetical protein|eukprot:COSAG06_NODE_2323_length_7085_cov_7.644718_9_plen_75_part_00